MLTSRRPDSLRLYDFYSYWRQVVGNFTTLPEYLKGNGYETWSLGKVFHPGASSNITDDYPLSWSSEPFHSPAERFMNKPVCTDIKTGELVKNVVCPVHVRHQPLETLPDIDTIRRAKELLANRTSPIKPMFLAIGLHKPHIPLRFPAHYLNLHDLQKFELPPFDQIPPDLPLVAFNPYTDIRSRADSRTANISFPFGPMPHSFGMHIRQAYYSAVSYVDDLVGELLRSIDLSRTVVVLTSDHGWSLGDHAEWAKYSNYEIALRVPLIIHDAQLANALPKSRRRIANVVELLDLFPTIVELANVPALPKCVAHEDACVEGRSLVGLLRLEEPQNASVAYSQYPRPSEYPQDDSDRPRLAHIKFMGYSVRTYQFRYTIWIGFDPRTFRRGKNRIQGDSVINSYTNVFLGSITQHEFIINRVNTSNECIPPSFSFQT